MRTVFERSEVQDVTLRQYPNSQRGSSGEGPGVRMLHRCVTDASRSLCRARQSEESLSAILSAKNRVSCCSRGVEGADWT